MIKKIGADVGNDTLKITVENNKNSEGFDKYEVMNVICPGYQRRILGIENSQLVNLLDVTIFDLNNNKETNLGRYFVGGLAYKESRGDLIEKTSEDIKAESEYTLYLLLTGLAYALYEEKNPVKHENISLGTVLPIEEYFNDDLLNKFKNKLWNKTYKVKFNSKAFNDAEITMTFINTYIEAEGAAATYSYTFNFDGTYKKGMENVENEVHLGIDIGSITTEITVLENGEFNSKGLFGINIGTAYPLDKIAAELKMTRNIDITRHQLDYILRKGKKFTVNIDGQIVDLTDELQTLKEVHFNNFIKYLVNQINKELSTRGINTKFFNRVNMTGGGSILVIDNFKKEFKKGNVILAENPRYANAIGSLSVVMANEQQEDVAADEVLNS